MTRAVLLLSAVILWPAPAAPETPGVTGWASAYAPGRMEEVITYRLANDLWRVPLAHDWYTAAGQVATNDCSQVGQMATLTAPDGREWRVLVADCGGKDGGAAFMTENRIVAELDWRLWTRLTAEHGRPLRIELR